jgi:RNA polymerase sigma factor (TIGR02999 family)
MSDVTRILARIESGDPSASEQLLPMVYDELRKLAAAKLAQERPGQTLQATALVHEAYIRLVDAEQTQQWNCRGHFFAAAAEAMRRILVEQARHKKSIKAGGAMQRVELDDAAVTLSPDPDDLLALDDALEKLAKQDRPAAEIARFRLFAGLSLDDAAASLGIPHTTAFRYWTYARAFLQHESGRGLAESSRARSAAEQADFGKSAALQSKPLTSLADSLRARLGRTGPNGSLELFLTRFRIVS